MRKKILVMIVVFTVLLNTVLPCYATKGDVVKDYGKPIATRTYLDVDGSEVTEKIYFIPDKVGSSISYDKKNQQIILKGKSGSGTYKNEKTHKWSGGQIMTYYAQGYFTWGNGSVKIAYPKGGVSNVPKKCTIC